VIVVSLQETHLRGKGDLSQEIEDLSMLYQMTNSFSHNDDRFSGVSILLASCYEIVLTKEWQKGCLLSVEAIEKTTGEKSNFVTIYCPHSGVNINKRLAFMRTIDEALLLGENNILLGDLNFATNLIDRTTSVLSGDDRALRDSLESITQKYDLTDSYRVLHPERRRYTYLKGRKGSRIDKIISWFQIVEN
jgi:exonuclease III